jgi:hypothetical protein
MAFIEEIAENVKPRNHSYYLYFICELGKGPTVYSCSGVIAQSNSWNKSVSQQYTGVGAVVI